MIWTVSYCTGKSESWPSGGRRFSSAASRAVRRSPSTSKLPSNLASSCTNDWLLSHHQRRSFPVQSLHNRHCKALVYGLGLRLNRFFATCPISCSRQLHRLSPSLSPCADGNRFRGYIQTGWRSCVLPGLRRFRGVFTTEITDVCLFSLSETIVWTSCLTRRRSSRGAAFFVEYIFVSFS